MNTINARIQQNEYHQISVSGITPAEAIILRQLHAPADANFSKSAEPGDQANYWKCIVEPVAAGEAQTALNEDEANAPQSRKRTNAEELARLRGKYLVRAASGKPGTHLIDDLWPGLNPALPDTFEEIGLVVAAPAAKPKKSRKAVAPVETAAAMAA